MRVATTGGWRDVVWEVVDGAVQTVGVFSTWSAAAKWTAERNEKSGTDSLQVLNEPTIVDYPDEELPEEQFRKGLRGRGNVIR